jgi:hypothetical protein
MITLPCLTSGCGSSVPVPTDESSPRCSKCGRQRPIQWFKSRGEPGTRRYQSAFDVWLLWRIAHGLVKVEGNT